MNTTTTINIGKGYTQLMSGQSIRQGDEISDNCGWRPLPAEMWGHEVEDSFLPVRRRVKPTAQESATTEINPGYGWKLVTDGSFTEADQNWHDNGQWSRCGLGNACDRPRRRPIPIPDGMELVPEDEARKFDGGKQSNIRLFYRPEPECGWVDMMFPAWSENAAAFIRPKSPAIKPSALGVFPPKAEHATPKEDRYPNILPPGDWVRTLDRLPPKCRAVEWFYVNGSIRVGMLNLVGEWRSSDMAFPAPDYWREGSQKTEHAECEPRSAWIKTADRFPEILKPIWAFKPSAHLMMCFTEGAQVAEEMIPQGWTHWQPATIPAPPETQMDEAEQAWVDHLAAHDLKSLPADSKYNFLAGYAAKKGAV